MNLDSVSPRVAGAVGVLALLPAIWFGFGRGDPFAAAVTMVNVVLISACLYLFMSPHETDEEHGQPA
jgi:hypothetical protein